MPGYNLATDVKVNNGGTLALSVGGTGGWTAISASNLLTANSVGFDPGSALGIDTTLAGAGGFSYPYSISGSMGLTKLGPNTLSLGGVNTYSGTTTVAAGTLAIANTGT